MRKPLAASLIALIAALMLLTGLMTAQSQDPTPTPVLATITPLVGVLTPTPSVPSPTPGCAAPLPLEIGSLVYVRGGTNVRAAASASSAQVNYYTQSVTVEIVAGPVCDNLRYNWWQVRGPGDDGWVAEGLPGGYWIQLAEPPPGEATCTSLATLAPGLRAELLRPVRVRDAASLSGLVLTVASGDAVADVLAGPVCADGLNWWQIRVTVVGVVYTGWISEGQPTTGERWIQIEGATPAPVCAPPLNLPIGSQAYVDYSRDESPKNMRTTPSLNGELVATLIDGIGFEVIGGPVCADGFNWWQIRILSRPDVTGWLSEGGPPNYWITPLRVFSR